MILPSRFDQVGAMDRNRNRDRHAVPHDRHHVRTSGDDGLAWVIRQAQPADVATIKDQFRKLHTFNASLDPRFALSAAWETHFDAVMQQVLRGDEWLCLIACETGSEMSTDMSADRPCGFVLAAVHRDSGMWYYHEWVEVEALYVEHAWRGSGLAEALLAQACAWATSIGHSVVQLYVTASNERAIRFYQHAGFGQTQAIMRKVLA